MGGCDDGVMADGCVSSRFQMSPAFTPMRELGCVWLASVQNDGLTSLAAPRSPAGFGARATRNVGGSFFFSASPELFSTEQSPEGGQLKKNMTPQMGHGIPEDANFADVDILPAV